MRPAFRVTATALAAAGLGQAALAGSFLNGHYDALQAHLTVAMIMLALAVGQAVLGILLARRGQAPGWVVRAAVGLPVGVAAQAVLGMYRVLGLHVPLGVLVVGATLAVAAWSWRA